MTDEEIAHLKKTTYMFIGNGTDPVWIKAFEYYNKYNIPALRMSCAPCFPKVIDFIIKYPNLNP